MQLGFPPKAQSLPVKRHCEISAVTRPTSDSVNSFIVLGCRPRRTGTASTSSMEAVVWAASFQLNEMVGPLAQGYAVAETDDGHKNGWILIWGSRSDMGRGPS